jgi:uncharacterized protein YggE
MRSFRISGPVLAAASAATAAALVFSACSGASGTPAASAATSDSSDVAKITAIGSGTSTATPDLLTVQLGIHTEGASAAATLDENNLRTQQLLDSAHSQGIDPKDIQTSYVSVGPRYDDKGNVNGYAADDTFTVKLRDLDTAGAALDSFAQLAGDFIRVQGVSYSVSDETAAMNEARGDAVAKAKAQAASMAKAAGLSLGRLMTITEVPDSTTPSLYAESAASDAAAAGVPVPLSAGTLDFNVQVSLVYELV